LFVLLVGTLDVVVVNVLGRVFIFVLEDRLGDWALELSVLPELNVLLTTPIPLVCVDVVRSTEFIVPLVATPLLLLAELSERVPLKTVYLFREGVVPGVVLYAPPPPEVTAELAASVRVPPKRESRFP